MRNNHFVLLGILLVLLIMLSANNVSTPLPLLHAYGGRHNTDYIRLFSDNESSNYTIVVPRYDYSEIFDEYVEWEFNGTRSDFIVNYAYTLRIYVDENHTLTLEASKKTSVENPNNSQASFDIYCHNHEIENKVIWSEMHLWGPKIHVERFGAFYLDLKNANKTISSEISTGNISIYPFIEWNLTYINVPLYYNKERTFINMTITNLVLVKELEISLKTGVIIDYSGFNYSIFASGDMENKYFDTVLSYAYAVIVANENASAGNPVYPSRIDNNTIYYEYENLTFQTVNLNQTYFNYLRNSSEIELKANTSIWYQDWTGTYEYHMDKLILNETIRTRLDPEIKTYGDFRIFNEEPSTPTPNPAPTPNPSPNEPSTPSFMDEITRNPWLYIITIPAIGVAIFFVLSRKKH